MKANLIDDLRKFPTEFFGEKDNSCLFIGNRRFQGFLQFLSFMDDDTFNACQTHSGIGIMYNALQMTILNRSEGQVDTLRLRFSDLLGTKMTSNPNFRNGVEPHIWDDYGKVSWYLYHPTRQDYEALSDAVSGYLEVFQDMSQSADRAWEQTM